MSQSTTSGGIGITTVLFLTFLILKLTNNIDWSWWWVTSPLWIPIVAFASIFSIALLIGLLYVAHTGKTINSDFLEKKSEKE